MEIISGLFDHMVLQRNAAGRSDGVVRGRSAGRGSLFVRINGRSWQTIGRIGRDGTFEFRLPGLRTGGPYRVELETRDGRQRADRLVVDDVLVGDVWLAAGQSNMEGVGLLPFAEEPHPNVRAFYMTDRWDIARDPIHDRSKAVDAVHHSFGPPKNVRLNVGTGPAVAYGKELFAQTRVPQGIIACAHGGRSMDDWSPQLLQRGRGGQGGDGNSLYGAMIRRFMKNGGRCAGLIWYQGESDAVPAMSGAYTRKMKRFVRAVRRDVRMPDLPIVAVQIARCVSGDFPDWNRIQEQQRLLPDVIDRFAMVPAVDLQLEDSIHIGGPDVNRLGRRLARAMLQITEPRRPLKPPIALRRCWIEQNPTHFFGNVVVEFDNVEGALISAGRPSGFSVASAHPLPDIVFNTRLEGNRVIVCTRATPEELRGGSVHYGAGANPYCNITDGADRSLPAFGPYVLNAGPARRERKVIAPRPAAG